MKARPTRDPTRSPFPAFTVTLTAVVLLGFALRVIELLAGKGGIGESVHPGYDESVYVGAAWLLRQGTLPYRDFVFVFPPGFLVLLWPVTQIAAIFGGPALAVTLTRLLAAAAGALNIGLIGRLGRRWMGGAGGIIAALIYATAPVVVQTEALALQEPFVNLGVLLASAVWLDRPADERSTRRLVVAGLLLGAAISIKLVAGIFLLPLLVAAPFARPVLDRVRLVLAACIPLAVSGALFAVIVGPRAIFEQAVLAQVLRPRVGSTLPRVDSLLPLLRGQLRFTTFLAGPSGGFAVLAFGAACVAAIWTGGMWGRLWGTSGLTAMAALLLTPSYFPHYGVMLAPAAALVFGWVVVRVIAILRERHVVPVAVASVALVIVLVLIGTSQLATTVDAFPVSVSDLGGQLGTIFADGGRAIAGRVSKGIKRSPAGTCIVAVRPQPILDANRVPSADRDGHVLLDVFGRALLAARHSSAAASELPAAFPAVQADILRQSRGCEFVVFSTRSCARGRNDITAATQRRLEAETRAYANEACMVLRRRPR